MDSWDDGIKIFQTYTLDDMLPKGRHIFEEAMIAKLMLLYPHWNPRPVGGQSWMGISLEELIKGAEKYKSILGEVLPLEQVQYELDINKEFKDVLKRLLDLDPLRRPSALAILESPEYEALNRAAHGVDIG